MTSETPIMLYTIAVEEKELEMLIIASIQTLKRGNKKCLKNALMNLKFAGRKRITISFFIINEKVEITKISSMLPDYVFSILDVTSVNTIFTTVRKII